MIHNGVNWAWMIAGRTHAQKLGCLGQRMEAKYDRAQVLHDEDPRLKVTSTVTELQETQRDDERDGDVDEHPCINIVR